MLVLDCGGIFGGKPKEIGVYSDIAVQSYAAMGYDAVNVSEHEFALGIDYLKNAAADSHISLLSTNLRTKDGEPLSWVKPYLIKKIGDVRVGILGVMSEKAFKKPIDSNVSDKDCYGSQEPVSDKPSPNNYSLPENIKQSLEVIAPEKALKSQIQAIKGRTDIIVLLSRLDMTETMSLVDRIRGIDLAISCSSLPKSHMSRVDRTGSAIIRSDSKKGKYIQYVKLNITDTDKIKVGDAQKERLDATVAHDDRVEEIFLSVYHKHKELARKAERIKGEKIHKERVKVLELSPEEFFKQHQEQMGKDG